MDHQQIPYGGGGGPYQPNPMVIGGASVTQFGMGATAYPPPQQPPQSSSSSAAAAAGEHQQQQQLHTFWAGQYAEIEATTDFKNHSLPLARIKKIMKADEDVRMISAEAPVVFARACEMFILELTHRSWGLTEENKRRTLQKSDIAAAITRTDIFDFLVDIVPREDNPPKDDAPPGSSAVSAGLESVPDAADYYYMQPAYVGAQQVWPNVQEPSSTGDA
ncbi:Nuclear transcription factor Y subunit C-2 [Acorus calamus]|uniref:Nuclear transcription factor Y subunit C-2 n=1 Tax=Acorus calamus TaxID=4465 RepID=A0AAV9ESS9_ACOCL|nr:Nuclear transcription factor Y subunit C-2 [Acorus calamus]